MKLKKSIVPILTLTLLALSVASLVYTPQVSASTTYNRILASTVETAGQYCVLDGTTTRLYQSFQADNNNRYVSRVDLYVQEKTFTTNHDAYITIQGASGTWRTTMTPNATVFATSNNITLVDTQLNKWVNFTFATPFLLTNGQKYTFVLQKAGSWGTESIYVRGGVDNSGGEYTSRLNEGYGGRYSGSSYTVETSDYPLSFYIYDTHTEQSITLASDPASIGAQVSIDGGGNQALGDQSWVAGSTHTLSATNTLTYGSVQYVFAHWNDAGGDHANGYTYTVPSSDVTVSAHYTTQYSVTMSGGGTTPSTGSAWYNSGSAQAITATPADHYAFSSWTTDNASITFDNYQSASTNMNIGGYGTVTANYVQDEWYVTISAGIGGSVTQTSDWVGNGVNNVINATESAHYAFSQWVVTGGVSVSQATNPNTTFMATSNGTIQATFIQDEWYATITNDGKGTVTQSSGWYGNGVWNNLNATANPTYRFDTWITTGGVSVSDPSSANTRFMVTANGTIEATFVLNPHSITFTGLTGALIRVDGTNRTLPYTSTFSETDVIEIVSYTGQDFGTGQRLTFDHMDAPSFGTVASSSYNYTVPANDETITITFTYLYNVVINGGNCTTNPSGNQWYSAGQVVNITTTPTEAYYLWSTWTRTNASITFATNTPNALVTIGGTGNITATYTNPALEFGGFSIVASKTNLDPNEAFNLTVTVLNKLDQPFVWSGDISVTSDSFTDFNYTFSGSSSAIFTNCSFTSLGSHRITLTGNSVEAHTNVRVDYNYGQYAVTWSLIVAISMVAIGAGLCIFTSKKLIGVFLIIGGIILAYNWGIGFGVIIGAIIVYVVIIRSFTKGKGHK